MCVCVYAQMSLCVCIQESVCVNVYVSLCNVSVCVTFPYVFVAVSQWKESV